MAGELSDARRAPPDQAPYAVAEAVFADAKAYLSSREAQQMSESELERELDRRGQELIRRLLQGHLDGRPPVRSRGSTMSSARSGVCRNATRRRPSGRCRLRARAGGARRWRRDAARPRERRRRPYGVVIDLITPSTSARRCLCSIATGVIEGACGTWSATVMEFTGARWCSVPLFHPCAGLDPPSGQLGWSRGGSEAPGCYEAPRPRCVTGTSTTREYQRHHAQRYADGIAQPVSKPPPPPSPPRLRRVK